MRIGEGVDFAVGQADGTDDLVLPKHRNGQHTSRAPRPKVRDRFRTVQGQFRSGFEVANSDRTSRLDRLAGKAWGRDGLWPRGPPLLEVVRRGTIGWHGMARLPIKP